jgi:thiol-disulfide isomerase/thioredoxin
VKERAEKMAPNLVGNQAPDLQRLESWDHKYYSLYDLDNDYIILIFWEPHCGHCKKEVPKLHKVYKELKDEGIDVEVMAVYTQIDRKPWEDFIKEKEINDWINVYDKYQFTNFRNLYDVYATPTIYVIDKDKKIIAKRIGSEQIKSFIEKLEKLNKQ